MTQQIKMRAVTGILLAGLVSTMLVATSPALAGDAPDPVITGSTKAGDLDRTFVGGKGYRVVPRPSDSVGLEDWIQALLVSDGGRIRTVTAHRIAPAQYWIYRYVLRSWTSGGWVDKAFYSGKARTIDVRDGEDGIGAYSSTVGESVSLIQYVSFADSTVQRIGPDGRLERQGVLPAPSDTGDQFDRRFLPSGGLASCSAGDAPDPRPRTLSFRNPSFQSTGVVDFPAEGPCDATSIAGSNLWMLRSTPAGVPNPSVRIARTSLTGVLDPAWGTDGYIDAGLPGRFGPYWGRSAMVGLADGSLYVLVTVVEKSKPSRVVVVRFTAAGKFDPAFGSGGIVELGGDAALLRGRSVVLEGVDVGPKGPVLSINVRDFGASGPERPRLVRLRSGDGALDTKFGSSGIVSTSTTTNFLKHDPQGRLLTLSESSAGEIVLARRNG